jgi:hypothetical protein
LTLIQITIASAIGGTRADLKMNIWWSLCVGINKNGVCTAW